MNRLPAKARGPLKVHQDGRATEPSEHGSQAAQSQERILSLKLLRFPAVRERTGLSRSTIWRLERHGDFPKHRRISANAVAWVEDEVAVWIQSIIGDVAI
jgi:prophage regulatory protein